MNHDLSVNSDTSLSIDNNGYFTYFSIVNPAIANPSIANPSIANPLVEDIFVDHPFYTHTNVNRNYNNNHSFKGKSCKTEPRKKHIEPVFALTEKQDLSFGALYGMAADSANYAHIRAKKRQNTFSGFFGFNTSSKRKTHNVFDSVGLVGMFFISILCIYFF